MGVIMLINNLRTPKIAVGRTITVHERPNEWKELIASNVNSKGVNLVVDGKTIQQSEQAKVMMNNQMNILIPDYIITGSLNCAYSRYEDNHVLLQKGNKKVTASPDDSHIKVDDVIMEVGNLCMAGADNMYIGAEIFSKGFAYDYKWDIDTNTLYLTDMQYTDSLLPSYYNYADIGKIPKIKNQGDLSICWATAAIAAIESSIMPKENLFFSAEHMALSNGNESTVYLGGEYTRAMAYLAAWLGPVDNKDAYIYGNVVNDEAQTVKHIQEMQIIESKNYESIKKAVFLHGGVQSYMYTSMTSANGRSSYYNKENAAYCYIGTKKANHAIVIIGWDDNYPKENFNMELEGNGAFICMNSWGTDFGKDGIFYVSYYDSNIGKNNVVYTGIEDVNNYDNIYQSDLAGWVGQLGYDSDTAYFANIYTAKDNELLKAVSFYATGKNTEYEIYYVDKFSGKTSLGRRKLLKKGRFTNAGYYTVELDEAVQLLKDNRYAIVVKIKTPDSLHPIAVEHRGGAGTQNAVIDDGEGYISLTGASWEHVEASKNCNLCLKMFTDRQ